MSKCLHAVSRQASSSSWFASGLWVFQAIFSSDSQCELGKKKKKKNPSVHYVFSTLIAAAARKPEATEQSSSLIGTNIIMGPFFHLSCEIQSIVVEVRSKGHYG